MKFLLKHFALIGLMSLAIACTKASDKELVQGALESGASSDERAALANLNKIEVEVERQQDEIHD